MDGKMDGAAQVSAYLAALPADQRAALTALRALLAGLLPGHLEVISYAMPGFRAPGPKGKMVAGYAAFARHLGLYPHSGGIIPQLGAACAGFKTSKSGVLFTPERPLPEALVAQIVALRQAEISAK
jgi:uncharacterized protein YdhG (YjbR/CyaY superfamily)